MKRRYKPKRRGFEPPTTGLDKFMLVSMLHFQNRQVFEYATCSDCQDRIIGQCGKTEDVFYCMVQKSKDLEVIMNDGDSNVWIRDKNEM